MIGLLKRLLKHKHKCNFRKVRTQFFARAVREKHMDLHGYPLKIIFPKICYRSIFVITDILL
jgi:hypothetical protein